MAGTINAGELPPEVRKQLGIKKPRERRAMTLNDVRTYAIRVLAVVADLTPSERKRVLRQAGKMNDV
jgi:hypothetical protein